MNTTTVVNIHTGPYDVYCGRPGKGQDGYFGNIHHVGQCDACRGRFHTRAEALALFKIHFEERIRTDEIYRERIKRELPGKRLGCFCAPKECHVNVIVAWLEKEGLNV